MPIKGNPVKQKKRYFHYLVLKIRKDNKTYTILNKRSGKDIWQNLYDFPMIEKDKKTATSKINELLNSEFYPETILELKMSKEYKHVLSHQLIFARFYIAEVRDSNDVRILLEKFQKNYILIPIESFIGYPVPRLIEKVINETKIL